MMLYWLAVTGISGEQAASMFWVQNIDNRLPLGKGKVQTRTSHEGPGGESRYISTWRYMGVDG